MSSPRCGIGFFGKPGFSAEEGTRQKLPKLYGMLYGTILHLVKQQIFLHFFGELAVGFYILIIDCLKTL